MGLPYVVLLRNGTAKYCPVGQLDSLALARLHNGTAASLPGCVMGLPRCVTGYHGFGVAHPAGRLHIGSPRYVTGIPIRNRTSWVSVRNIYTRYTHAQGNICERTVSWCRLCIKLYTIQIGIDNCIPKTHTQHGMGRTIQLPRAKALGNEVHDVSHMTLSSRLGMRLGSAS